jgi:hypothetical protein
MAIVNMIELGVAIMAIAIAGTASHRPDPARVMTSKLKLTIVVEGEGPLVDRLGEILEAVFKVARPVQPAPKRFEDCPPVVNIAPLPRRHRSPIR